MSSEDIAIRVSNLGKCYQIYDAPRDRLKQFVVPPLQRLIGQSHKQYFREFWALKDVSFEVRKGETIGVIGRNSSGKSTLLQLICGTLNETTGSIQTNGRVAALLELGAGFNPEFTGRENVYMSGALLGLSKKEIDERFDDILAFADIGDFIGQPVKTYSSGMFVRLAFSINVASDPDVMIVDEALAVGDMRFQQKCYRKLQKFRDDGHSVLFVSHDLSAVKLFCNTTIWLEQGQVKRSGIPNDVAKEYISFMAYGLESETSRPENILEEGFVNDTASLPKIKWESTVQCESFGEGGATILATAFYSKALGEPIVIFEGGETVCYYVKIKADRIINFPIIGFTLNDDHGVNLLGYNSHSLGIKLEPFEAGEVKIFCFEFKFPRLRCGYYLFSPAIAEGTQGMHEQLHWVHDAFVIQISSAEETTTMGFYFFPENALFSEINS